MWTPPLFDFLLITVLAAAAGPAAAASPPPGALPQSSASAAPSSPPAAASPPAAPTPSEGMLAQYRERFKLGMAHYKEGAVAEAIGYWEPIYRQLGNREGYRLAFNLGVAYEELGDATRAAERLGAFLAEVDARRTQGEAIAPMVQKEEADARARMSALAASKGRIEIDAGSPPRAVMLDASEPRLAGFVAWVTPGDHAVTFSPGMPNAETQTVHVGAGQVIEIAPSLRSPAPRQPPSPASLPPATSPFATPNQGQPPAAQTSPAPFVMNRETVRPFSLALPALAGGLALAAAAVAVPLEARAWTLRGGDVSEQQSHGSIPASDRQSFAGARTGAYAAIGAAVGLGVVAAALTSWYLFGASRDRAPPAPTAWRGTF